MKTQLFALTALLNLLPVTSSFASNNELKYGECLAKPDSKKYIESDFDAPYPKNISFSCDYLCRDESGTQIVNGVSIINVSNLKDEGLKVVCQGVRVKYTGLYYKFLGTEPFYAFQAQSNEVKAWAFERISRDNPIEIEKLRSLKEQLSKIAAAYIQVGGNQSFSYYKEAGEVLDQIAQELPIKTNKLEEAIQKYVYGISEAPNTTKEGLLISILSSSARFRIQN